MLLITSLIDPSSNLKEQDKICGKIFML